MANGQRPILIAVHQAFSTKYLLDTEIFKRLKAQGVPLIVLSPNADDPQFQELYRANGVVVEKYRYDELSKVISSRLCQFFIKVRSLTLPGEHDIATIEALEAVEVFHQQGARLLGSRYLDLVLLTARLLRRSRLMRRIFAFAESRLFRSHVHKALFATHRPSLLVVPDVGTVALSNLLIAEAKRHGVPVASVVLSWDNPTSKGLGSASPDYAIAWNRGMKEELEKYHGFAPSRIFVGGVAHFDDYFRDGAAVGRGEFLRALGLSSERKTLFLATASPSLFHWNVDLIKLLLEAIDGGVFAEPCQLVVRLHPVYLAKSRDGTGAELAEMEQLQAQYLGRFAMSIPEAIPQEYGALLPMEDQQNLAAILQHSDVMVCMFSTLMLEACIFDLPVVNVAFYTFQDTQLSNTILKGFTHIKRVASYDAVRTADSEQEMLDLIHMYLADRSIDREGRALMRDNEGSVNKGKAGAAIADHLYDLATSGR